MSGPRFFEQAALAPRPQPASRPIETGLHGRTRSDPFGWLRSARWRDVLRDPGSLEPEIRAYLEGENAYAETVLAPLSDLRRRLVDELKGRLKDDDETVPVRRDGWLYYSRFLEGADHPLFCRRRDEAGAVEEILLDGVAEGRELPFLRFADVRPSPDHRLLAYAVDENGSEFHKIRIRRTDTGAVVDEIAAHAQGDIAWANDSRTLFYTVLNEHHRPDAVRRHVLRTPASADANVVVEADPGFHVRLAKSDSDRFIVVTAFDHALTSEVHLISADDPLLPARLVAARSSGVSYNVADCGEQLVIRTNADGADDFKVVLAPLLAPERGNWRDFVAHRPGRLIRSIVAFRDFLIRVELVAGVPEVVVLDLWTGEESTVAFEDEVYDIALVPGSEFAANLLRLSYSSLIRPAEIYDYDLRRNERLLRKRAVVPSGHDPERYVLRRLFATGHDGTLVPISLLHRRDLRRDRPHPVYLYGYGAYGIPLPSAFAPNAFSLVDRGFVVALAHTRGGVERGSRWYRQGKLEHKANTFRDFIKVAEFLIESGYTRKGMITAHGISAGGLLVGAVANMRPDLFCAVVAEVPFVDVLNTMCDDTLPLTPPEWHEWGNPITDPEAYDRIAAYSPYDNVGHRRYPHVLATGGLADPRVTYWEPAKWVARLRANMAGDSLVLLRTHLAAGHGGSAGRYEKLEEVSIVYAFILAVSGLADG